MPPGARWASPAFAAALLTGCPPVLPEVEAGPAQTVVHAHSHNDYEHSRPLLDALDLRFDSVEADLYWTGSDLGVSHSGPPFKGTLRELYLDPLAARVAANGGSVAGDGLPFFLWLDFKESRLELQNELARQLSGYPMLTRFDDDRETPGAVTVVLTGDASAKKAMVAR